YWNKYALNPIIQPDEDRPFESNYCTSHSVLPVVYHGPGCLGTSVPGEYQIWYATRNRDVQRHKYFAIATAICSARTEGAPAVPPPEFSMSAQGPKDPRLEPLSYLTRYERELTPRYRYDAK